MRTTNSSRFSPPVGGAACPYRQLLEVTGSLRSPYIAAMRAVYFTAGLKVKVFSFGAAFYVARKYDMCRQHPLPAGNSQRKAAKAAKKAFDTFPKSMVEYNQ